MTQTPLSKKSLAIAFTLGVLLAIAVAQFLYSQRLANELDSPRSTTLADASNHSGSSSYLSVSYADAVAKASPSVVKVYTTRVVPGSSNPLLNDPLFRRFFNRNEALQPDRVERGLGSGVIVDTRGYVLTNYHLIENVDEILVMLADGRVNQAIILGVDEETDLAVLQIDRGQITAASFARAGTERIGDVVLAIGNPYGIGQTVTQGIISATGRHGLNLNTYENYIQTDAAINQGNSGGALVNTAGEIIGINSSLYSRSGGSTGIGFAIPAETARHVLENIIQHGRVVRGWLGISIEEITPSLNQRLQLGELKGLLVTSVAENGPAGKAGIRMGDILTHIGNQLIDNGNSSMHEIAHTPPGTKIPIRLVREGSAQSILVTIGERPVRDRSN